MARVTQRATYHFKIEGKDFYLVKTKGEEVEGKLKQNEGTFFYLNHDKYFKVKGHITSTLNHYEDAEEIITEKLTLLIQGLSRRLK